MLVEVTISLAFLWSWKPGCTE